MREHTVTAEQREVMGPVLAIIRALPPAERPVLIDPPDSVTQLRCELKH